MKACLLIVQLNCDYGLLNAFMNLLLYGRVIGTGETSLWVSPWKRWGPYNYFWAKVDNPVIVHLMRHFADILFSAIAFYFSTQNTLPVNAKHSCMDIRHTESKLRQHVLLSKHFFFIMLKFNISRNTKSCIIGNNLFIACKV